MKWLSRIHVKSCKKSFLMTIWSLRRIDRLISSYYWIKEFKDVNLQTFANDFVFMMMSSDMNYNKMKIDNDMFAWYL